MKKIIVTLFVLSIYYGKTQAQSCDMYVGGYVPTYRDASSSLIDYSKVSHAFYAFGKSNSSGALIMRFKYLCACRKFYQV